MALLVVGLLIPAHIRALDEAVLKEAGRREPAIPEIARILIDKKMPGPAQMVLREGKKQNLPGLDSIQQAVATQTRRDPFLFLFGKSEPSLNALEPNPASAHGTNAFPVPFIDWLILQEHRQKVLEALAGNRNPLVVEILRTRMIQKTVAIPPSGSASGQAFDAAVGALGLLAQAGCFRPGLSNAVFRTATVANVSQTDGFEEVLLETLALCERLDWGQLAIFWQQLDSMDALRTLAVFMRQEDTLPAIWSATMFSHDADGVAAYLKTFGNSGAKDLGKGLRYGPHAVKELLVRSQGVASGGVASRLGEYPALAGFRAAAASLAYRQPGIALGLKWLSFLAAGFFFAVIGGLLWGPGTEIERPLRVRGIHIARKFLFALGFLLVVLLLSEPFLAQESQKVQMPFHLRLPIPGQPMPAVKNAVRPVVMNQLSLLTMLLFFVLQGLLYVACLVKLAEIHRQRVPARIKIRLLENEDHLFDAGLYLGFVGTIISLILVSLGVIKQPSLMAAYSSTSFGIIFVSVFKIFNLRPARRRLLMETETAGGTVLTGMESRPVMTPP
jgi:hypothetical protein